MAANKNLDPTTCTTAVEAFKYPLPQVRQFHRSLTAELDEKNARLRTLVGGSYRQLLGTAEMILQMREDIGDVEDKLGRVGKGCGRGVIGGMASGLGRLQDKTRVGRAAEEMEWSARMKVLDMCGVVAGKLLRKSMDGHAELSDGKGKNLVLAGKVLVLSRLLMKSVVESVSRRSADEKASVEDVKRKLDSLRRKLSGAIKKTLEKTIADNQRTGLVQALSAYSLSNSSGAKDILWYFLRVRGDALALTLEPTADPKQDSQAILRSLELYTKTMLDVQALVPRRLSEALASLKTTPLLKDEALRDLEGLRLDVCEKWFGDEILFFIPYIRHDDIEGEYAVSMLKGWAKKASEVALDGLTKVLGRMAEFKTVVDLRTEILRIWIREGGKAKGFDPSVFLDGLRKVINDRMVQLLESRVSKLHLVGTEVEATLGSWKKGITDKHQSLWDDVMLETEISSGAVLFKQGILTRTHGRNDAVSRAFRGYQTWRYLVDEITVVLEQLKKQRWDDDLEDIDDDLSLESRNALLSTEDPQMLQDHLDENLGKAYKALHEKMASLIATYEDSEDFGQISVYVLRIIRDIRSELPKNFSLETFGLPLVPGLHERLSKTASHTSLEVFGKTFTRKSAPGRALWEGDPELPVQPSPSTFKFLQSLLLDMTKVGADLWSPTAIRVLKRHLRAELGQRWTAALKVQEGKDSIQVNGNATNGDVDAEHQDSTVEEENENGSTVVEHDSIKEVLKQTLFDVLVLQSALGLSELDAEDEFSTLEETIHSRIDLDPGSRKRLQQAAKEYWKRTNLLFGLLS
jgi:conserved oligomeric Golgi complex subunit 1